MRSRAVLPLTLLTALALGTSAGVGAEDPVPAARAMLAAWHEEPARIDRARAILETAAASDAAPETLIELARAWFLTGDFRARAERERAGAYEHGSEAARRAVAAAPRDDRAHLWLAINLGRAAEIKGLMRALEADPHQTGGRLELARLYLGARRWRDAERELSRVVDEPAATDLPR